MLLFLYRLKVCGSPAASGRLANSVCSLVSLTGFGDAHNISDFHYYHTCHGEPLSVMLDITFVIVLWHHEPHPVRRWACTHECCVPWGSTKQLFPVALPIAGPPCSLRHNDLEIRPVKSRAVASKCSSERDCLTSLTLNQNLETMKPSEKSMWKAEIGQI